MSPNLIIESGNY